MSLYNETLGEGIYPTPVIGIVGIAGKRGRHHDVPLPRSPDQEMLVAVCQRRKRHEQTQKRSLGSSEYAKEVLGQIWGMPPALDLKQEAALQKCLRELIQDRLIESAHDCSEGGMAVALAEAVL